jgi:hypothetical protein
VPRRVHCVLAGLADAEPAVHRGDDPDDEPAGAATDVLWVLELRADDRELAESGVDDPVLQFGIAGQDEAENRRPEEQ